MNRNIFKRSYRLFGLIVFGIILYKTNFSKLAEIFQHLNPLFLLPVYLSVLIHILMNSFRCHIVFSHFGIKRTFFQNMKLFYSGFLLGSVTPAKVGEIYIPLRLKKEGYPVINSILAVIIMRIIDLSLIFIFATAVVVFIIGKHANFDLYSLKYLLIIAFCILSILFILPIYRHRLLTVMVYFIKKIFKTDISTKEFYHAFANLDIFFIIKIAGISILMWLYYFSQQYFLALNLGIHIQYFTMILILFPVTLAAALPVTVAGIGTREFALINCLSLYGVSLEESLSLSIMIYTLFLTNCLFAVFMWYSDN